MAIGGHKTRAVFDRYNSVRGRNIAEAGARIEGYLKSKGGADGEG